MAVSLGSRRRQFVFLVLVQEAFGVAGYLPHLLGNLSGLAEAELRKGDSVRFLCGRTLKGLLRHITSWFNLDEPTEATIGMTQLYLQGYPSFSIFLIFPGFK